MLPFAFADDSYFRQAPRPTQRRSHEHDESARQHSSGGRHYDALGQDPARFSRSHSHDNIVDQQYGLSDRPKPRSSSHGQSGPTYPSTAHPMSGSRRTSDERAQAQIVSHHRRESSDRANPPQSSSSIRFPVANNHADGIDGMPSDSLVVRQRTLSGASINSTTGHRTVSGHHGQSSGTRSSRDRQHEQQHHHRDRDRDREREREREREQVQTLHPVNSHTYAPIPTNEQLGPRSRRSSLNQSSAANLNAVPSQSPTGSGYPHPPSANGQPSSSNGCPITTHSSASYSYPTPLTSALPSVSPNVPSYPQQAKPLPPKPENGMPMPMPFPEPHMHSQPQASGSGSSSTRFHITPGTSSSVINSVPMNVPVDPNSTPQEMITIHGSRSRKEPTSRPPIPVALTGRRAASGGAGSTRGDSPNRPSPYGTSSSSFYQQSNRHSMSNPNLHISPQSHPPPPPHSHSQSSSISSSNRQRHERSSSSSRNNHSTRSHHRSSHERSRSSSRNPDTVVYPRYEDSAVSDTATTVMSTRTPRLRRTSGARVFSGGASRPTTPGFTTDGTEL